MRGRGAAFVALGAVAALLAWLLLAVDDRPVEEGEEVQVPSIEEVPEVGEEEELEPVAELEAGDLDGARTVEVVESGTAGTAVAEPSADAAQVRGVLRDAGTSEPLPLYALRVQEASGRWEDLTTDEGGRFASGSPMAGGTLRITPFDDPSHRRSLPVIAVERHVEAGEARDLDLEVPCGPTYRLSISPANAVVPTTLTATLFLRSPDDARSLGPEPLRAGDPPWVRFAAIPRGFDRAERIEVRDKEGYWVGSANVSALAGIVPGLVDVVLDARAVLIGKVVDPEGTPVRGASVVLEGLANSGKSYERKTATRPDGEFRFEYLVGGSGTVSVRPLRHVGEDATIRLPAGALTRQDFILAPLPPAGAVRGRLESETGTYEAEIEVALRPLSGPAISETRKVRWEEIGGRRVGQFEFEALPAGEYEIAVHDGGWFAWEPRTLVASPPSEVARFQVHDDLAHAEFAFRARDADTGVGLDAFASWNVRGGASGSKRLASGERFLTRFPLERGFRWRLDRQGYRPAFGDEKAFAVEEPHDGALWRIAEIELEPGWGEVFRVVGRAKQKPIEGAKILLDGREAGTTSKDGTCTVSARERPRRVEIAYRDWRVVSSIDLRPAWRRKNRRFVEVQITPPAK